MYPIWLQRWPTTSWMAALITAISLAGNSAEAQHTWQKPSAPIPKETLQRLIGSPTNPSLSDEKHIVWVWGYDGGHQPGSHDYTRVRDLMVGLLRRAPMVTVETAYLFPTKEQFGRADLVVMFLHLPTLNSHHFALLDPFLQRGGGLVAIHETMIQRPRSAGRRWAERIGLAWSEGDSQWGALFDNVSVDPKHPIFQNFPDRISIVDEFYWRLAKSEQRGSVGELASTRVGPPGRSRGPIPGRQLSEPRYPVFWTVDHPAARVFCSLPGHNTFTYYDPRFRLILFRGMAWAMQEQPNALASLVAVGIEKDGKLGVTDAMRNWPQKPRDPTGEGFKVKATVEEINRRTNAKLGLK